MLGQGVPLAGASARRLPLAAPNAQPRYPLGLPLGHARCAVFPPASSARPRDWQLDLGILSCSEEACWPAGDGWAAARPEAWGWT